LTAFNGDLKYIQTNLKIDTLKEFVGFFDQFASAKDFYSNQDLIELTDEYLSK
jgi:hypothetical protein